MFNLLNDINIYSRLLEGIFLSLGLTILSLFFGFLMAICHVFNLYAGNQFIKNGTKFFLFFTRSVPIIVQIFLLYYGLAQFEGLRNSFIWPGILEPFFCALVVLAFNSSAYTATLLQGSIEAIPLGEIEAAQSLQLTKYKQYRFLMLPRVLSSFWPVYSNEAIQVLKATSLVNTITLVDLMGTIRNLISETYDTFTLLFVGGLLYIILSYMLIGFFKWLDYMMSVRKKVSISTANDFNECTS